MKRFASVDTMPIPATWNHPLTIHLTTSKETLYGNLKVAYADHKMAPPSMVRGEGGAFVAIMHPIQLLASCGANSRLPILLRAHLRCADGCAGAWFDRAEV